MSLASRHNNHAWALSASTRDRDSYVCARCDTVVETASGSKPSHSRARIVNGQPFSSKLALPPCTGRREAKRNSKGTDRANLCASREWRDLLTACSDVLGRQRVREHLGLTSPSLTEEQEIALVRLHAAVRVYLLDAHDELEIVTKWARARRRDDLVALAQGVGGEQTDGARRVPVAGGAM